MSDDERDEAGGRKRARVGWDGDDEDSDHDETEPVHTVVDPDETDRFRTIERDGDDEAARAQAEQREHEQEDELADAVSQPARSLPPGLVPLGLLLLGCSALPLTPSGASFLRVLIAAFVRSPIEGVMMLIGFGSPFLFGLLVALAASPRAGGFVPTSTVQRLLITNASTMHAQLVLIAFLLWRDGIGVLPGALLGFAVVSGGIFVVEHARQSAAGGGVDDLGRPREEGPPPRWLIRWTATMIVALCGWLRLQILAGVAFGFAIEVALALCVAITLLVMRAQPR